MKRIKLNYILIILIISALLVSCGEKATEVSTAEEPHEEEGTAELTAAQIKTAGIMLGKIERRQISGTVKVNGVLDAPPQQMVSISIPFGGFFKSTDVLKGSPGQTGQLITVFDNPD